MVKQTQSKNFITTKVVTDKLWSELRTISIKSRDMLSDIKLNSRRDFISAKLRIRDISSGYGSKINEYSRHLDKESATEGTCSLSKMRSEILTSITTIGATVIGATLAYMRYVFG